MRQDNVLFITLDSCRLDTAISTHTPNLDRIGRLIPSYTTATFTLPAHLSFFSGFLPVPTGPHLYLGRYARVWRSQAARPTSKAVYEWIDTPTIIEHYGRRGYLVHGVGGVQFFDPRNEANFLPALFDSFEYCGPSAGQAIEDGPVAFTAHALETAVAKMNGTVPFFLFANLSETHYPYHSPGCSDDEATRDALRIMQLSEGEKRYPAIAEGRLIELLQPARTRQRESLRWIDTMLGRVLDILLNAEMPTLIVVCADHGESFGEGGLVGHGHPAPEVMTVPMWAGLVGPTH
ncbi:sulfatase-like hydrolase/transferase [Mycolicibacterium fluoranthenivorans]|uniref:sulfatase-like hydrolase/transferase n=1 Tax=Mycolicibacterium fluoranthenivorans TaxID=258505 RepID=UPI00141F6B21|nr:sulfatase-like hydrolase/transferase [Mycolicibacterium fluoranthenivorans]MCV7358282.1 sulfatase-like hydrolase/transferase [Mycolicibacterium fluoranthenivorans]